MNLDRLRLSDCVSFKFNSYDFPIELNLQQNGYIQTFTTVFNPGQSLNDYELKEAPLSITTTTNHNIVN